MSDARPLALITGASSGIGATFARQLAARGYNLVLVARRVEKLHELARELTKQHPITVETMAADLTADTDVEHVAALLSASPNLTLLINNAGFGTKGYFHAADAGGQEAMHRLHVLATERLCRAALPGMVARQRGGIINVASVAGFIQGIGNVSYCATKAWMNSFTEGLWMEMKAIRSPVAIQALCPGYTYSEFHDVMGADRGTVPGWLWMKADFVVAESLRGLDRHQLFVIPSFKYRMVVRALKLLPRFILTLGARRYRKPRL